MSIKEEEEEEEEEGVVLVALTRFFPGIFLGSGDGRREGETGDIAAVWGVYVGLRALWACQISEFWLLCERGRIRSLEKEKELQPPASQPRKRGVFHNSFRSESQ